MFYNTEDYSNKLDKNLYLLDYYKEVVRSSNNIQNPNYHDETNPIYIISTPKKIGSIIICLPPRSPLAPY